MRLEPNKIYTPRGTTRIVDFDWNDALHAGAYELTSGRGLGAGNYTKSAWAFACATERGEALANLPWRLVDGSGKVVPSHPLIDMLTNFGRESNYIDSVASTEIDLLMYGAAYWLKDVDIIQRLNPTTIEVVAGKDGIKGFNQKIDGRLENEFGRDDIVYFREFHPNTDLLPGVPVYDVAKRAIFVEYEANLYLEAFFKNDATPSLFIGTEKELGLETLEKFLAWWNKTFRGSRKAGKVGIADNGMKPFPISTSLKEMALHEIREQAREDICTAFRVPKILVGGADANVWSSIKDARRFLLEDIVIPRSNKFAGVINTDLVKMFDPSVKFEYVPSEVELLQENDTDKATRLAMLLDKQIISPEYFRAQMNIQESDAPKVTLTSEETAVRAWRRKSLNALKAGKSANVEFETADISISDQLAIRAKLDKVTNTSEIEAAFNGRS